MRSIALTACLAVLSVAGSDPPVVGDWKSDRELPNGEHNTLNVYDDFTAEAKIYAHPAGNPTAWVEFEFEADWEDFTEEFEFKMDCSKGPCDGDNNNFDMTCEVVALEKDEDIEVLDCKGSDLWANYVLQWDRDL